MHRSVTGLLMAGVVCGETGGPSAEERVKSGFAHLLNEDYEKAAADFEAALNLNPNDDAAKSGLETIKRRWGGR